MHRKEKQEEDNVGSISFCLFSFETGSYVSLVGFKLTIQRVGSDPSVSTLPMCYD